MTRKASQASAGTPSLSRCDAWRAAGVRTSEKYLLTIHDIAEMLGIGQNYARRLPKLHGDFPKPVCLFGNTHNARNKYYKAEEVRQWISRL